MDGYKLRKIDATVGMFGDFTTFKDVLNKMIKIDPRLGIDDTEDLVDALNENGGGLRRCCQKSVYGRLRWRRRRRR